MPDSFMQSMLRGFQADIVQHEGEVIVIGLGRFGSALARTLMDLNYEVLGVDANEDLVAAHSGILTHVVQADSTREAALRQIGAADAVTVAVCIGTDIEASVLTTALLDELGVPNIWAKAITEAHGKILQKVGAHHVVFPEAEMGERVAHLLTGQMQEYVVLDENFVIAEMQVPEKYVGIALGDSDIRASTHVTVVVVKPEGAGFTYAEATTVLGPRDLIVVAGKRSDVETFADG